MFRYVFVFILFLALVLLQTTFLVYFPIFGMVPNIVFGLVLLFAFFEASSGIRSFWYAIIGGVMLDLFSANFFGLWTIILLSLVFLVKFLIKSYVRSPIFQR